MSKQINYPKDEKDLQILEKSWKLEQFTDNTVTIMLPPPNVSGRLHMGHALNISIIDSFVRTYRTYGYNSYILPGLDHGGIATEFSALRNERFDHSMDRKIKFSKIEEFANECKAGIIDQLEQFKALINWDSCAYTLNQQHLELVTNTFIELYKKGLIYRGKKLINWDTKLKTAVSDLEIDYKEEKAFLYEISYTTDLAEDLIVQTTRPETIFADTALAVNPNDARYKKFIGSYAYVPIINRKIRIIGDTSVEQDFGSGVLKITPAHDKTDFEIGKRHDLELISIINEIGNLDFSTLPDEEKIKLKELRIEGMKCAIARLNVGKKLSINTHEHVRKVPYSSKSDTVIEYRFIPQWFFDITKGAKIALEKINEINIFPDLWKEMFIKWLENTETWCISRDITWGHPMPVWYRDEEVFVGMSAPDNTWTKTEEVLDTWFSSALWPLAFKEFPTKVLVTGYDIMFFWAARMIMMLLILDLPLPFNDLYFHRLVRDSKGQKMSKSKGNVLDPIDLIKQEECNLDAFRLSLISKVTPTGNINYSDKLIKDSNCIVTKLLNCSRYIEQFVLNNLTESINKEVDDYYSNLINIKINEHWNYLQKYEIHMIYNSSIDLLYEICDWLIEMHKVDKSCGSTLIKAYKVLLKLIHPICPIFTTYVWHLQFENYIYDDKLECSLTLNNDNNFMLNFKELVYFIRKIKSIGGLIFIKEHGAKNILNKICKIEKDEIKNGKTFNIYNTEIIIEISNKEDLQSRVKNINIEIDRLNKFFSVDISRIPTDLLHQRKVELQKLLEEKEICNKLID